MRESWLSLLTSVYSAIYLADVKSAVPRAWDSRLKQKGRLLIYRILGAITTGQKDSLRYIGNIKGITARIINFRLGDRYSSSLWYYCAIVNTRADANACDRRVDPGASIWNWNDYCCAATSVSLNSEKLLPKI